MLAALEQTEKLLRQYGHVYEANLAAIAQATYRRDPAAACQAISSDEWWDSSHSVAAIDLGVSGGFTAAARRDALRLRLALCEIFETLRENGERNDAAEIIVSQFHKWMESHV